MKENVMKLMVALLLLIPISVVASFNDASIEVNEVSEGFSEEGMLGSFIYKYGHDKFRPEGYITREDLIVILKDYHAITKKLLDQNKIIISRLNELDKLNKKAVKKKEVSDSGKANKAINRLSMKMDEMINAYSVMYEIVEDLDEKVNARQAVIRRPDKKRLWIDDFDSGKLPNLLGGEFGAWEKSPDDRTQFCRIKYTDEIKVGKVGYSVMIYYDVDSPNPAFNGMWMKLQNVNLTQYRTLCMSVKGDTRTGYTKKIRIELKNRLKDTGSAIIDNITDRWQEIEIPFEQLKGLTNLSKVSELVFVFDDSIVDTKSGIVYIDNIYCK